MALVLSRKENESIIIGDSIRVTVAKLLNGKVGLSVTAPNEIPIHRQEVWEAIHGRPYVDFSAIDAENARDAAIINDPDLMAILHGDPIQGGEAGGA